MYSLLRKIAFCVFYSVLFRICNYSLGKQSPFDLSAKYENVLIVFIKKQNINALKAITDTSLCVFELIRNRFNVAYVFAYIYTSMPNSIRKCSRKWVTHKKITCEAQYPLICLVRELFYTYFNVFHFGFNSFSLVFSHAIIVSITTSVPKKKNENKKKSYQDRNRALQM